jgi:hypothetical protein
MQSVDFRARADTQFGYFGWGIAWTNGVGAIVAVPVASVTPASSDEAVVPVANVRYLGDYDIPGVGPQTGVFWFNPLDAAPTDAVSVITFSATETGTGDDVMVNYTVAEDLLVGSADGIAFAEATSVPA